MLNQPVQIVAHERDDGPYFRPVWRAAASEAGFLIGTSRKDRNRSQTERNEL